MIYTTVSSGNNHKTSNIPQFTKYTSVSTINDSLKELLNFYLIRQIVVFYDRFDHIEKLDIDASRQLLLFGELVHPSFKIICSRRSLLHSDYFNLYMIHFKPYTDNDLMEIIHDRIKSIVEKGTVNKGFKSMNSPNYYRTTDLKSIDADELLSILKNIFPVIRVNTAHVDDIIDIACSVLNFQTRNLSFNEATEMSIKLPNCRLTNSTDNCTIENPSSHFAFDVDTCMILLFLLINLIIL